MKKGNHPMRDNPPVPLSPETQDIVDYLKNKIKDQQNGFKLRRNKNRAFAIRIKMALIILSAVITILLGLRTDDASPIIANIAFVISAIVTALAVIEEYFEYQGMWIRYNITFTRLKSLEDDLDFLLLSERNEKTLRTKLNELYARLKDTLDSTNSDWLSIRKKDTGT
jgi:hypothetical protein